MKRHDLILVLNLALIFSCTLIPTTSPTLPMAATPESATRPGATPAPSDCTPTLPQTGPPSSPYSTIIEPFDLKAPSGNRIYGLIRRPDPAIHPGLCFAAVILVPGGINPGRMQAHGAETRQLAEAGMVVLTFNAEGRVDDVPEDIASEGSEDHNGFRHQDGLCAIVKYAIGLDYVIDSNVGLKTQSYGITMGAGCAGRHPEIPIKYIVDGEGPPSSFVTCHEPFALDGDPTNDKHELVYGIMGHYSTYRDPSSDNLAFWAEREAIEYIGSFRGRYLRLQATWDHAQPPSRESEVDAFNQPPLWWNNKHTTNIVNAAIVGGVPWVRVNLAEQGNPVNATYDMTHPPTYLPGKLSDKPWGVRAVLEMARME